MFDDRDEYVDEEIADEAQGDTWITTFADMVTLLLAFFVLLFSMSVIDEKQFTDSFLTVRQVFGGDDQNLLTTKVRQDDSAILESVRLQKQLIEAQRQVYSDMRTYLNKKGLEGQIGAVFDEGVITLRLPAAAMFENGKVTLSSEGYRLLEEMRQLFLKNKAQVINIKGYTDDLQPSPSSRYRDNWEISALRAVNVLRYYIEHGIEPQRLTATGLGDLDPLMPNINEANRAQNRRVEFVFERRVGK
ncbi:OmpA/MotB family protein [Halodesulfovibrio spirochaetisodalis]|uniref:Flagellar motor protein MotB n=1 Tax=Halodesulfovibrio spirochaetisodalis TaxID=1560234 RepID=A0A1B7XCF1_9BACT|nr:flagellar motor protein MotB [Halodesulfovibrio spirochaetisodalis]OBQ51560.1 flagellar motor protein MotB [Halodesulfovibrio spirochaetisodalis]